jgi:hypothetical protein
MLPESKSLEPYWQAYFKKEPGEVTFPCEEIKRKKNISNDTFSQNEKD